MARISRSYYTVPVSMIRVRFHLRVHTIIVMLLLLLLSLLHLRGMIVGETAVLTRDYADLLIVLVSASRTMFFSIFQAAYDGVII